MKKIDVFKHPYVKVLGCPFFKENQSFLRVPYDMLHEIKKENLNLISLAHQSAGVHILIHTKSPTLTFHVELLRSSVMNHMSELAESGFDIYYQKDGTYFYLDSVIPIHQKDKYEVKINLPNIKSNTFLIYAPLYNQLISWHLEVSNDLEPLIEDNLEQIVFYGTSITQGACASRPGLAYPAKIGRLLNITPINYGFSGNGLGELSIMKCITRIQPLKAIVIDYEANAGAVLRLMDTLEPMIDTLRKTHQNTPIFIVSRIPYLKETFDEQMDFRSKTHKSFMMEFVLKREPYEPIFFIDGKDLCPLSYEDTTVDGIHLNDLGFDIFSRNLAHRIKTHLNQL